mmetsp:Transcript_3398/g.8193  ORF Transcript_3398/g.8193 Transcript_3398/m.8193 type:complete len:552 (-) Transcript_3398:370-2025(-)
MHSFMLQQFFCAHWWAAGYAKPSQAKPNHPTDQSINQSIDPSSPSGFIGLPHLLTPNISHFSAQMGMCSVEFEGFRREAHQYGIDRGSRQPEQENIRQEKAEDKPDREGRHDGFVQRRELVSIHFFHHHGKHSGQAANDGRGHEQNVLDERVAGNVHPFAGFEQLDGFFSALAKRVVVQTNVDVRPAIAGPQKPIQPIQVCLESTRGRLGVAFCKLRLVHSISISSSSGGVGGGGRVFRQSRFVSIAFCGIGFVVSESARTGTAQRPLRQRLARQFMTTIMMTMMIMTMMMIMTTMLNIVLMIPERRLGMRMRMRIALLDTVDDPAQASDQLRKNLRRQFHQRSEANRSKGTRAGPDQRIRHDAFGTATEVSMHPVQAHSFGVIVWMIVWIWIWILSFDIFVVVVVFVLFVIFVVLFVLFVILFLVFVFVFVVGVVHRRHPTRNVLPVSLLVPFPGDLFEITGFATPAHERQLVFGVQSHGSPGKEGVVLWVILVLDARFGVEGLDVGFQVFLQRWDFVSEISGQTGGGGGGGGGENGVCLCVRGFGIERR